ncbi:MAG: nucleotide exchange factor GrpE [Candidatus Acetothermia bacterium]|jgi:molecular chaperone GrpE|nr:nucleotide exchange factor GrpE [Candidatus Acetothermia bacterium]
MTGDPNERQLSGELPVRDEASRLRADLLRLAADFDNYRKEVAREREALASRAVDEALLAFLPVCDALERALAAFRQDGDAQALGEGLGRVSALAEEVLRRLGCEPIPSVGRKFDPAYHEVLSAQVSDEERYVILEEFERGFVRNGRVLRPAKVKVSLGREGGDGDGDEGKGDRH